MKRVVDFRFFMPPLRGLEAYCALFPGRCPGLYYRGLSGLQQSRSQVFQVCRWGAAIPMHAEKRSEAFHEPAEAPPGFGVRQSAGAFNGTYATLKAAQQRRTPKRWRVTTQPRQQFGTPEERRNGPLTPALSPQTCRAAVPEQREGRGRTVCSSVGKSRFRVPVHSQGRTVAFGITITGT